MVKKTNVPLSTLKLATGCTKHGFILDRTVEQTGKQGGSARETTHRKKPRANSSLGPCSSLPAAGFYRLQKDNSSSLSENSLRGYHHSVKDCKCKQHKTEKHLGISCLLVKLKKSLCARDKNENQHWRIFRQQAENWRQLEVVISVKYPSSMVVLMVWGSLGQMLPSVQCLFQGRTFNRTLPKPHSVCIPAAWCVN